MRNLSPIITKMIIEYAQGLGSQTDIAKRHRKSVAWFNTRLNSVEGQALYKFHRQLDDDNTIQLYVSKAKETARVFNEASPHSAKEIVKLTKSKNEAIRLKACNLVVDKSEYEKERLKEINKPQHITYTEQQIALFKEGFRKEEFSEDKDVIDG